MKAVVKYSNMDNPEQSDIENLKNLAKKIIK